MLGLAHMVCFSTCAMIGRQQYRYVVGCTHDVLAQDLWYKISYLGYLCMENNVVVFLFILSTVKPELTVTFIKQPTGLKQPLPFKFQIHFNAIHCNVSLPILKNGGFWFPQFEPAEVKCTPEWCLQHATRPQLVIVAHELKHTDTLSADLNKMRHSIYSCSLLNLIF